MQLRGHHDVVLDSLDQRRHQPSCLADPIGERCAIELDAFARIDAGLPIERKMIAVLADQNVREKPCTGLAVTRPNAIGSPCVRHESCHLCLWPKICMLSDG